MLQPIRAESLTSNQPYEKEIFMSLHFNADEILRVAEQIERNGTQFYRRAATVAVDAQISQLLSQLAAMEEEHGKIFTSMREALSEQERKESISESEDQAAPYLRAWADSHVFDVRTDPAEQLMGKESVDKIFQLAIGLEKDSIVFYLGMKEAVPVRLGRDKIDKIIQEEMRHIALLSREFETRVHQLL